MKLHYIQHVPHEGLGGIATWAQEKELIVNSSAWYKQDILPSVETFDCLVIMGGPMGVYEERKYSWLTEEKRFIEKAINARKPIIGICLGSQLLASVLGARVYRGPERQIGWFPVRTTENAKTDELFQHFHDEFMPLHWHGDTFDLPNGAVRLGYDDIYQNQAFCYERCWGLQFHVEAGASDLENWLRVADAELNGGGDFVQSAHVISAQPDYLKQSNEILVKMMDSFQKVVELETA